MKLHFDARDIFRIRGYYIRSEAQDLHTHTHTHTNPLLPPSALSKIIMKMGTSLSRS